MRYHPISHRIGHTIRWWTEPCSQDGIRTHNDTTFMTSRVQMLMNRGVFRVRYHFLITYYLTNLYYLDRVVVRTGIEPVTSPWKGDGLTPCRTNQIVHTVGIEPKRCGCKPLDLPSASGPTWSGRRDSNPQQPAWKAGTLPIELLPQLWLLPGKFRHVLREWGGQSYLYHGCWLSDNHLSQTSVFYRPKLNKRLNVL